MAGLLDKERIIAPPGFNRWLVPPAALAIHLSIGMAYGFSVFWLPLSRALGIKQPIACPPDMGFFDKVFATSCDWQISMLGWMFTLFFVFLGSSAAVFGHWLETAGPRHAGVVAAFCWGGGLLISALGVYAHQIWLMWLGSGVIGGIGLGLGYISPVSTLIRWFPDRRGMATGMAIMGFGGGAMIGAPLADRLMNFYATGGSVGVWQTFVTMGLIYCIAMLIGAFGYRVPPIGWQPAGWTPKEPGARRMITTGHVHVNVVHKTPQFWLLWGVLCLNVSAGIGVIGMASPMLQEVFGGKLIGIDVQLAQLAKDQRTQVATIGAAFAGLLSLFNIVGRIGWASASDYLGRKTTYVVFFLLGVVLYGCGTLGRRHRQRRAVRGDLLHHPHPVRGRLRHHSGVSRRHLRHAARRRDPRASAHGLVGCRRAGAGGGELHPRVSDRSWRAALSGVQHHDVRARRHAAGRVDLQPAGAAGRSEVLDERRRARGRAQQGARRQTGRRRREQHRHLCGHQARPAGGDVDRCRHPARLGHLDHDRPRGTAVPLSPMSTATAWRQT